jgi:high frequency lysogenization protein
MKDRTLALSGVFQATELVRQAACHGTWSGYAATACLQSLFILEAESAGDIYGGAKHVKLGVETLLAILQGESRYADLAAVRGRPTAGRKEIPPRRRAAAGSRPPP